jgi:hypothetical protein
MTPEMTPQSEVERIAWIIIDNVRPPTQAEFDAIIVRAGNAARLGRWRGDQRVDLSEHLVAICCPVI